MSAQNTFLISALFYLLSLISTTAGKKRLSGILLAAGLLANACSIILRYRVTLPMLPLYQGPFFLPFVTGLLALRAVWHDKHGRTCALLLNTLLAWAAVFFPNDHYLPFIQFKTVPAHLFFIFSVVGRAFFLLSGILAYQYVREKAVPGSTQVLISDIRRFVIRGYLFWTLSIFSGAVWSYIGWGTPLVWEDPAIVTAMATWLFYSLYLHLHLVSFVTVKASPYIAVFGAVWVIAFNCVPEMGKFMLPMLFIR